MHDGEDPAASPPGAIAALDPDEDRWEVVTPEGSEHAPAAPIHAAFGLEATGTVWVLTAETAHVLDPDLGAWIRSGERSAVVEVVADVDVLAAVAHPARWTGDSARIYLAGPSAIHELAYDSGTERLSFVESVGYGSDWHSPHAPAPWMLLAGWADVDNTDGWFLAADGGQDAIDGIGAYLALLTGDGSLHIYDREGCHQFVASHAAASAPPFDVAGAPDPRDVRALAWTGARLWAFTP